MKIFLFLLLFLLLFIHKGNAVTYYISSSSGNDNLDGQTTGTAWATLTKLSTTTLNFGDIVSLCIGDTWWSSSITASVSGVTYTSYDCNVNPNFLYPMISTGIVLDGSLFFNASGQTGLLQYDLSATSLTSLAGVWVDQQRYVLARSPNMIDITQPWGISSNEFWMISSPSSTTPSDSTDIYSDSLGSVPDYYYILGTIRIRTANWLYEHAPITWSGANLGSYTVTLSPGLTIGPYDSSACNSGGPSYNYLDRFYIDNIHDLSAVDAPGEWYYDGGSKQLYLRPVSDIVFNAILNGNLLVSISPTNPSSIFTISANSITINNLWLSKGIYGIIQGAAVSSLTVQNSKISQIVTNNAILLGYSFSVVAIMIQNVTIKDVESDCINIFGSSSTIQNSDISYCGIYAGYASSNNGIIVKGGVNVLNNRISYVGYAGILPHNGAFISGNTFLYTMISLNDGGALYTQGASSTGVVFQNNIVDNVIGNYNSCNPWQIAPCFYVDGQSTTVTIRNNTCNHATRCYSVDNSDHIDFLGNTCYSPSLYLDTTTNCNVGGNIVMTSGTDSTLQNALVRTYFPSSPNYINRVNLYKNVYIELVDTGNYLFQRQTSSGTIRYNDGQFLNWIGDELATGNPNFEAASVFISAYAGQSYSSYIPPLVNPIFPTGCNPWTLIGIGTSGGIYYCDHDTNPSSMTIVGSGSDYYSGTNTYEYEYIYQTFQAYQAVTYSGHFYRWTGQVSGASKFGIVVTSVLSNPSTSNQMSIDYLPFANTLESNLLSVYNSISLSTNEIWLQVDTSQGSRLDVYYSIDGINWIHFGNTTYNFLQTYYIGNFICSHVPSSYWQVSSNQISLAISTLSSSSSGGNSISSGSGGDSTVFSISSSSSSSSSWVSSSSPSSSSSSSSSWVSSLISSSQSSSISSLSSTSSSVSSSGGTGLKSSSSSPLSSSLTSSPSSRISSTVSSSSSSPLSSSVLPTSSSTSSILSSITSSTSLFLVSASDLSSSTSSVSLMDFSESSSSSISSITSVDTGIHIVIETGLQNATNTNLLVFISFILAIVVVLYSITLVYIGGLSPQVAYLYKEDSEE